MIMYISFIRTKIRKILKSKFTNNVMLAMYNVQYVSCIHKKVQVQMSYLHLCIAVDINIYRQQKQLLDCILLIPLQIEHISYSSYFKYSNIKRCNSFMVGILYLIQKLIAIFNISIFFTSYFGLIIYSSSCYIVQCCVA